MLDTKRIEDIENRIFVCTKCPETVLARLYPMPGFHGSDIKLTIIGVNPGPWAKKDADILNSFGGDFRKTYDYGIKHCQMGEFLTGALEAMSLTWEDIFFTNVIKCATPRCREPSEIEVKNCSGYLQEQIEAVQPKNLLFLSEFVAKSLEVNVKPMTYEIICETMVAVIHHPSYLKRTSKIKEAIEFLKGVPLLA